MLRINKLVLNNFGAYYGTSTLTLSESNGVTIIWGYNGHGKTTIMNGFRYVLWGEIFGRNRRRLKPVSFVNTDSIKENKDMLVELYIEHNGMSYIVSRGLKRKGGDGSKEEDYEKVFLVKQGSNILSNKEAEDLLSVALPNSISRFYLFDGELLQEYEDLLDDTDQSGQKIKESIETILGMPILLNGREIFETITSDHNKAVAKASQGSEVTIEQSKALSKLNEKLDNLKKSRTELQEKLESLKNEKGLITEKMENTSQYSQLIGEKKAIEGQISEQQNQCEEARQNLSSEVDSAWLTLASSIAKSKVEEISESIKELSEKEQEIRVANSIVSYISSELSKDDTHCPVCKTELDEILKASISKRFSEGSSSSLSEDEKTLLAAMNEQIGFLKGIKFVDSSSLIKSLSETYRKSILKLKILETQLSAKKKEISNVNHDPSNSEDTIMSLPKRLEKVESLITEAKSGIEQNQIDINSTLGAIEKINAGLKKLAGGSDLESALWNRDFVTSIRDLFEEGISSFRIKLKDSVEKDATDIFKLISHAPDLNRLSINDNFGLSIIKDDGTCLPNRSSGYEQVVAISLISALHKNAPIEGPVFMDSTFQRIDTIHKKNTLKSLPVFGNQIIVLAYEDEIGNINDVRATLGESLLNEYEIKQYTSSHSELKNR